jgi:UPF0755 protein
VTNKPPRGIIGRIVSGLFKLALLAGVVAAGVGWWHFDRFTKTPVGGHDAKVVVGRGESLHGVVASLRAAGVRAGNDLEWQLLAARMGVRSRMQVGEYAITPDLTPEQLLRNIANGKVVQYHFTLVEGWNMRELRAALKSAPNMRHLLPDTSDAALMEQLGRSRRHPEGRFLPETYAYTRGSSDIDLLGRAAQAMDAALAEEWARRDPELNLRTSDEALILASIVEKETALADERTKVAGVFVRRLQEGMKLETDPTIIYGLGSAYTGVIRQRDKYLDTPYNTYTRTGLPPTPIAMPGRASLHAAMHPDRGNALFFVASRDGGPSVFSTTLAEHNKAVAAYRKTHHEDSAQ